LPPFSAAALIVVDVVVVDVVGGAVVAVGGAAVVGVGGAVVGVAAVAVVAEAPSVVGPVADFTAMVEALPQPTSSAAVAIDRTIMWGFIFE
jgi:hypothetical protein